MKSTSQLMMRRTGFFLTQILLSIENKSHNVTGGACKQDRFSEHQRDKKQINNSSSRKHVHKKSHTVKQF